MLVVFSMHCILCGPENIIYPLHAAATNCFQILPVCAGMLVSCAGAMSEPAVRQSARIVAVPLVHHSSKVYAEGIQKSRRVARGD